MYGGAFSFLGPSAACFCELRAALKKARAFCVHPYYYLPSRVRAVLAKLGKRGVVSGEGRPARWIVNA